MVNSHLVQDFQNYANSFGYGFLKTWKASSMLWQLARRQMWDNEVDFLAFLLNCLEMEGFRKIDVELIMGWLYDRKNEIVKD